MKLEEIILKSGKWQASFCGEKSLFSWSHTEQNDTVEPFCVVLFIFPLDGHCADSTICFAAKYDKMWLLSKNMYKYCLLFKFQNKYYIQNKNHLLVKHYKTHPTYVWP